MKSEVKFWKFEITYPIYGYLNFNASSDLREKQWARILEDADFDSEVTFAKYQNGD